MLLINELIFVTESTSKVVNV